MTCTVRWRGNQSCKMLDSFARWVKLRDGSQALVVTALVNRTYLSAGIRGRRGERLSWFRRSAASCRLMQPFAPLRRVDARVAVRASVRGDNSDRSASMIPRKADVELWCWLQVAIASEARRGEVCALRWCDLDKRFVRIERSVSATSSAGVVIKSTKTGKPRVVSLTTQTVNALLQRRAKAIRSASAAGRDLDESELIFATDRPGQQPWRPDMVTGRWTRLRKEIGPSHVRLHDLRHFVATEVLTAGIDLRTVANRLGHAAL